MVGSDKNTPYRQNLSGTRPKGSEEGIPIEDKEPKVKKRKSITTS